MSKETRELTLRKGRFDKSVIYRVKKHWSVIFKLTPEFFEDKTLSILINYPEDRSEFVRDKYQDIFKGKGKVTELQFSIPGSFHYMVCTGEKTEIVCDGFVSVEPSLPLPLDSLVCQTVLSKLLGPLSSWRDKLEVAHRSGYNMIHFTPIQRLGNSNSAYSLSDQLKLNLTFSAEAGSEASLEDVATIVRAMRDDWGMLSLCDIVLNHTANETPWLKDYPEATYNLSNSPHLRPAFIFDRVVKRLARDIGDGLWVERDIPKGEISTTEHIETCKDLLLNIYLPKVKITELFLPNIEELVSQFEAKIKSATAKVTAENKASGDEVLKIIQDPEFRRNMSTVDLELAVRKYNRAKENINQEEERISSCVSDFQQDLLCLVSGKQSQVMAHIQQGVENIVSGAAYQHVEPEGPRLTKVSVREDEEFVAPYFTSPDLETLEAEMSLCWSSDGALCMAHNGWVMGDDPLNNFALPGSEVYLRRELVAWGDSVKLRYGDRPADSPFLWHHMASYVESVVRIFDGVRLDNCHSTPLHVASWLLDRARQVRPDLYVSAELFTGSEEKDGVFVNTLGITSLIREALAAWDSHELGRMVYKYGGETIGTFQAKPAQLRPLLPSTAHALFYDWTHDNDSPVEKKSLVDLVASAGLVSMAACGVGSNRGYDELVPHHIHVVSEARQYAGWAQLGSHTGMVEVRRALAELHTRLATEGFSEVFVDQKNRDVVAITRHSPADRRSVIMVAHTQFFADNTVDMSGLELAVEGKLVKIILEASITSNHSEEKFVKNEKFINGIENCSVKLNTGGQGEFVKVISDGRKEGETVVKVSLSSLPPGAVVVLELEPQTSHQAALTSLSQLDTEQVERAVAELSLLDVQFVLYQCSEEGKETGFGTYNVPGFGDLNYCGLAGLVPVLDRIRENKELGHPLAANLRAGDWLLDYITARLQSRPATEQLSVWFSSAFSSLRSLPRYLIPRYFDSVIMTGWQAVLSHSCSLMSPFVREGSELIRQLSQGSVIHSSHLASAPLPPLSANLSPQPSLSPPTLAAGLPHFSTGFMRSWGRDTFISLRGLLLVTGRFTEARDIILGYAATLRHGLIPNLLDGGRKARYNCRDAVWWWLQAVVDYVKMTGDSDILTAPVVRLYPTDDAEYTTNVEQPLQDIINEALTVHLKGLKFRERNAGIKIDEHMKDNGFNNQIGVDPSTGFVFGGNVDNCGTWMDKMGSSSQAGNKGSPSSPRDGSAVEIVGLSYSCLRSLAEMEQYKHQELPVFGSLRAWADTIRDNFDKFFWVGSKAGAEVEPNPELVNCDKILKDSVGSGGVFTDYQLRCNYVIPLALCPDITRHAWPALQSLTNQLLGPLGLATLHPGDWAYRGEYDNSNQSEDRTLAHGANYHQGPEWLWPVGFYLRALINVSGQLDNPAECLSLVRRVLARMYSHLADSDWMGLPELTNRGGALCRDSNPIQAWSMATLLDTLYDIQQKDINI